MVHRLPITKARINLGQVVKRVHVNKEYFILEKDAFPSPASWAPTSLRITSNSKTQSARRYCGSNADIAAGRTRPAEDLLQLGKRRKKATTTKR